MDRTTNQTKKIERWRRYEPLVLEDLQRLQIDIVPSNLAAILAKVHTGEGEGGKGLFLIGNTGTGKTRRMEVASELFGIEIVSAKDLVRQLQTAKDENEEKEILRCMPFRYETPQHFHDLIIDDLGIEPLELMIYGTRKSLIIEAIYDRYKVFTDAGRQWKTHFTSNLTKDEIRARYGERIWSRLNEMVVFVTLAGKDRRVG